ncbi:hypothetical protein A0H81_07938 [Grifola frondosa]|uniref:Uncharacterized protein n=1 Tax=Grifola frondosa TaxID=5627 RepID=A0A1C7M8B9_GRIFR|nr:hypothetical protein A0H81_07938 [Grifola frondosa]
MKEESRALSSAHFAHPAAQRLDAEDNQAPFFHNLTFSRVFVYKPPLQSTQAMSGKLVGTEEPSLRNHGLNGLPILLSFVKAILTLIP